MKNVFASRVGVILVGAIIGVIAVLLQYWGNPPNMGVCVACFERDIAGALGLHRAGVVQYMRPEIIGFVLGALAAALMFRDFKARAGSAPIIRFVLGFFAMVGALVFLGCPWRALLRLAGGDLNAILGLAGLAVGVFIGTLFLRGGYNLGRTSKAPALVGLMLPLIVTAFFVLMLMFPAVAPQGEEKSVQSGVLWYSVAGPGAKHAIIWISLGAGLLIGFIAQRSRFCTMGAFRDVFLFGQMHLMLGVIALVVTAVVLNLILGQFHAGFVGQPIAHSMHVWNFLGMVLAGWAFALAGGCPGRQLFMAGEGDGDAATFVLGMIAGAAFAHNFSLASGPDKIVDGQAIIGGPGAYGDIAVYVGLAMCLLIGLAMRMKKGGN